MKKILSTTLLLFTLLLAACSVSKSVLPAQASPVVPITGNEPKVAISGFAFDPATITIKVGQSVTWTNLDSAVHTVTADDNSWKSNNLDQGGTFSRAFTTAGTYTYHCSVHVEMKGSVIVLP